MCNRLPQYTATVYEKGAEVIRMLYSIVGKQVRRGQWHLPLVQAGLVFGHVLLRGGRVMCLRVAVCPHGSDRMPCPGTDRCPVVCLVLRCGRVVV